MLPGEICINEDEEDEINRWRKKKNVFGKVSQIESN
jgi:hypothetical protein